MKRLISAIILTFALCIVAIAAHAQTNERGIDQLNFDTTCAPCRDFNQFANGSWIENNPIPAEYGSWTVWHEMNERNEKMLHEVLEQASVNRTQQPGSMMQKIGVYYYTAMDTVTIEAQKGEPIQADLERIAALSDIKQLHQLITDYNREGASFLFDFEIYPDLKNSEVYSVYVSQGGLGLPDRDYYTRTDEKSAELRQKYVAHITRMFQLLGDSPEPAAKQAAMILALETRLAEASLTNVELRDPYASYNMMTLADADAATPNFSWNAFFNGIELSKLSQFSLCHPRFFGEMNRMLTEIPIEDWKTYLRWHLVSLAAPRLSSEFFEENFDFYSRTLNGVEQPRPRWKRVLSHANWLLGEAIGQLYVEKAFPAASKERALELINNLRASLKDRLNNLEWMSDETKKKALEKLATFTPKIGYPDKWRDYSALEIKSDSYLANVRRCYAFERQRDINKIGQPIDRTEWGMPPQIVNAYYNPLMNEIVFPAAILQPPFFDASIDDAVNYGAIGAVIGHELLHGFDDEGSKFDAVGNLSDWWTEEDRSKFEERTQKLSDQYSSYMVLDGLHINGDLTLGENIADLGGVIVSYYALQKALEGTPRETVDGLAPEQRFFLSWAQVWRTNQRPEELRTQVQTDPHSPGKYRTNGPLVNLEEFYKAFGCKPGDDMFRDQAERVKIW